MDIKVENYLPVNMVALGLGLVITGMIYAITGPLIGVGLMCGGLILSTTQYRLAIDFNEKYYREYVWLLGLKWGKRIKFSKIEYFYITRSKTSQEYGPVYRRISTHGQRFNGYLKFSETEKIFIGNSTSKNRLLKKVSKINSEMRLPVNDYA